MSLFAWQRARLIAQIEAVEKLAEECAQEACSTHEQVQPLQREREELAKKAGKARGARGADGVSADDGVRAKKRGKVSDGSVAADPAPAHSSKRGKAKGKGAVVSVQDARSSSTSSTGSSVGSGSGLSDWAPEKFSDGIGVPSFEEALTAAGSEALQTITYKHASYRVKDLQRAQAAEAAVPGLAGQQRLRYLLAKVSGTAAPVGFVLWREEWGKRGSYLVQVEQLSFQGPELKVAHQLLEAMLDRLEKGKIGRMETKLPEKPSLAAPLAKVWEQLGFSGAVDSMWLSF